MGQQTHSAQFLQYFIIFKVVFQPVCPKSVTSGMRCKVRQIFSFQSLVLKKISNFVLRLDEETGSAGEQPVSNKAAPTLKAVNVEGRL